MKKLLPCIFIILFPYLIGFLIYSLFNPVFMEFIFQNNIYLGLFYLFIFWSIALISAIIISGNSVSNKRDAVELAWVNMIIKLVQIPAYLFIFVVGLVCMITIFTFMISFFLMLLDCAAIILSGLIGVSAIKRSKEEGILSGKEMIFHGILQFIFCGDVVSSILVFRKVKRVTSR